MRSLNDYFLLFPEIVNVANAGVTAIIPVPDGGKLVSVVVTEETAITVADEDLTFSTRTAAGTAVAVTNGVITVPIAGSAIGRTTSYAVNNANGTNVVPKGGSLQMVNDSAAAVGTFRVAVVMRR